MPEYKISCNIHDNKLTDITVPLIEELQIINSFNHNFLIIIDDYSLFGVNVEHIQYSAAGDWSKISLHP